MQFAVLYTRFHSKNNNNNNNKISTYTTNYGIEFIELVLQVHKKINGREKSRYSNI